LGGNREKKHPIDFINPMDVRLPHTMNCDVFGSRSHLPLAKKLKYLYEPEPVVQKKPERPRSSELGKGIGGELASRSLTGHFMKQFATKQEIFQNRDPRTALFKYDELAKQDPVYFGRAYGKTQPTTILAPPDELALQKEEELNERIEALAEKRKRDIQGDAYEYMPARRKKDKHPDTE